MKHVNIWNVNFESIKMAGKCPQDKSCVGKEVSMKEKAKNMETKMRGMIGRTVKKVLSVELSAVGVVEIILILVVLIALVIIFQDQLTQLVNNIFSSIRDKAGTIY